MGRGARERKTVTVNENYPTVNELSYPTVYHDPKIGNHERIKSGSDPPKSPTIPHVVEREARNGERQPKSVAGTKKTATTEQLPLRPLPKEPAKRELAREQQTIVQKQSRR